MEIKQYAPVIIPTLNRYNHFKRCLESLERCTGADKTDVYVGLDYPPTEKYVEGWKKIDAYLVEKEKIHGFNNLFVRRRKKNCGVGNPNSNTALLRKEIENNVEYYICTEDDNEFSPNFLEYMNKGLELYKDTPNIMLISGYSYPSVEEMSFSNNVVAAKKAAAWGFGRWTGKTTPHQVVGGATYRDNVLKSWRKSLILFWKRPVSLNTFLSMKFRNKLYGDCLYSASFVLEGLYCIFPKISKVRNWGHDGSGVHCDSTDTEMYIKQRIDTDNHFEYDELIFINNLNSRQFSKNRIWSIISFLFVKIAIALRYIFFRISGKDLFGFYFER